MIKTYDCALVLTGENEEKRYILDKVVELFRKRVYGYIFVCGGHTGLKEWDEQSEAERTVEYLLLRYIPESRIFIDGRSRETLGNFTFATVEPLEGNPSLNDLDSILLVTEEIHMNSALAYAKKVIPSDRLDDEALELDYNPGIEVKLYNFGMLRALRLIRGQDPEAAHRFLIEKHPFYSDGWFENPIWKRKLRLIRVVTGWIVK